MSVNNQMQIVKDLPNKKIVITRNFDAMLEDVWRAWTESELLDQWWAPKPWKTETKFLDFREGGHWLYAMVAPDQSRHWARVDFKSIDRHINFLAEDYFCDEAGNRDNSLPGMTWKNEFKPAETGTKVIVSISFANESDLVRIVEMGFETGFTMALSNLDEYFKEQFRLRKEFKTNSKAKTSTYLNFPGNTEEAFNFYKKVFGTEFAGGGIRRFGDIPAEAGGPPVAEEVKKLVLHVELPILGGHLLMATDSPKEMGFTITQGNNMHICLEPETKAETRILFDALSQGGAVTMPLEDMFFGSYFGTCTDKYGINWMFNCIEK